MKNTSHYKITISVLILCILVLFGVHYFLYRDIVNKNKENATMLDYISSESSSESYAVSAQKQLQSLDSDIKKVRASIVGPGEIVAFIENIENIARTNGLTIKNNSIEEVSDTKIALDATVNILKVRSTTKGSWAGTYRFLSALENMPYKIRVNSLSTQTYIGQDGTEADSALAGQWESNFEIIVLKYK